VLLGGNIMNNETYFLEQLKENLKKVGIGIPIVRSLLGEDAAIFGVGLNLVVKEKENMSYEI
jgi:hypothetical protein